jgi:DNA repair exonuclease SbcCD ATPase subunit
MEELIKKLLERRAKKQNKLKRLLETPTSEKRDLTEDEDTAFREIEDEIKSLDKRIGQLREIDERARKAAETSRRIFGEDRVQVGAEPEVYRRGGDNSFFRDLYRVTAKTDWGARERLENNNKQVADAKIKAGAEARAINTTFGAGGKVFAAA